MALDPNQVKAKVLSPKGIAVFPHLITPDTKYNAEGEYSTKLRVTDAEAAPIIETCDKLWADYTSKLKGAAKKKAPAGLGYELEFDDEGEETGFVLLKFGTKATYVDKKTKKIMQKSVRMFDSKGNPTSPEALWGGSTIMVSATAKSYAAGANLGIKMYIEAVMVIEIVNGSGGNASAFGFAPVEGGYEADNFNNAAGEVPEGMEGDEPPFDQDAPQNDDF